MLVDTHCHLDMLDDVDGVLARMRAAGVGRAVTIGVDAASSAAAVAFAEQNDDIYATVGLHPHDAKDRTDGLMAGFAALAATSARVVGIGEAGLDYHYDNSPRAQQRAVFAEHIRLASSTDRALVIHSREAWDDTFAILIDEGPPPRFVFHCFSGGPAEAERALAMGAVLSYSGVVTFRNADSLRTAAALTPLDRLVVETDAPFLTPVPHRGKPNEPAFVAHTARRIAEVKVIPPDDLARATTQTAATLFGWS